MMLIAGHVNAGRAVATALIDLDAMRFELMSGATLIGEGVLRRDGDALGVSFVEACRGSLERLGADPAALAAFVGKRAQQLEATLVATRSPDASALHIGASPCALRFTAPDRFTVWLGSDALGTGTIGTSGVELDPLLTAASYGLGEYPEILRAKIGRIADERVDLAVRIAMAAAARGEAAKA